MWQNTRRIRDVNLATWQWMYNQSVTVRFVIRCFKKTSILTGDRETPGSSRSMLSWEIFPFYQRVKKQHEIVTLLYTHNPDVHFSRYNFFCMLSYLINVGVWNNGIQLKGALRGVSTLVYNTQSTVSAHTQNVNTDCISHQVIFLIDNISTSSCIQKLIYDDNKYWDKK